MDLHISENQLIQLGLNQQNAFELAENVNTVLENQPIPEYAWQVISKKILSRQYIFSVHQFLFSLLFPKWQKHPEIAPAWVPTNNFIASTNIFRFMNKQGYSDIRKFHSFTINRWQEFWKAIITELEIVFYNPPGGICDLSNGNENCSWLPGALLNIVDSCLTAPDDAIAILYQDKNKKILSFSYAQLKKLVNQVANGLVDQGFRAGDAIGIAMPMDINAVAIYLGIIKMGGIVVSIADSFSSGEIDKRLQISQAKAIFTQDFTLWSGKKLALYDKIKQTTIAKMIVLSCDEFVSLPLRSNDIPWRKFLSSKTEFTAVPRNPMEPCNILFSSGTTAEPKAIVWNHTTPIKVASDAYFHQNIQENDILAWPTNLGWMMGPWLIFAALINQATLALYPETPKERAFGEFIQNAKVTMLGIVPTLVAYWRQTQCMDQLDWSSIKVLSSTGECSNPEDMLYLMSLANYQPIIEYCGGTEIGGAYLSSTVIEKNYLSLFSTPAMGMNFTIINEKGQTASTGEVAIIPPSIGLSIQLLNADHHLHYHANMPMTMDGKLLRRHGDQIKHFSNGYYNILGRVDDAMNLGGIKISAVEIERTLSGITDIIEVAAIAVSPQNHGPSQLVIYVATNANLDKKILMQTMQKRINTLLNPLFKIHDIIFVKELIKTASNKIMRRSLRKKYIEEHS